MREGAIKHSYKYNHVIGEGLEFFKSRPLNDLVYFGPLWTLQIASILLWRQFSPHQICKADFFAATLPRCYGDSELKSFAKNQGETICLALAP